MVRRSTSIEMLARKWAYTFFGRLWSGPNAQFTQKDAYAWLQRVMGMTPEEAHIERFDKKQCQKVVEAVIAHGLEPGPGR
jgi:hypothetical protein